MQPNIFKYVLRFLISYSDIYNCNNFINFNINEIYLPYFYEALNLCHISIFLCHFNCVQIYDK